MTFLFQVCNSWKALDKRWMDSSYRKIEMEWVEDTRVDSKLVEWVTFIEDDEEGVTNERWDLRLLEIIVQERTYVLKQ